MNAANQRQLTPVLVALAALLGALLLLLLAGFGRGVRWDTPRTLAPLPPAGPPANLLQPVPLQQYALVWQRPLFSPDRKPVARTADGGSNLGDLELTGIILTPELRMALLRNRNGDHREVRLREGQALPDGSATLLEVHPRSAVFATSAGRTELKLPAGAPFDGQKGAAAGSPAPAAPADAMISIGPHGAGRQNIRSGGGRDPQASPPSVDPARQKSLDQLRESVQKRRAAKAAAANEEVH
ncbi:general secretion pathway protein GspN [Rhodanobacter denitrificans]|uniref:General secretion pathway protein GspN n=1 Tax=Rhodanobacter denitrificans TaxID=666685 RepID=A0A368KBL7_9GAMM|nr:general secretion pathway protein GspN [Rhodanobacter denitrificans]RCS29339.1 general secretion pathway protein GspN [Rhodanobacter denitrificans]